MPFTVFSSNRYGAISSSKRKEIENLCRALCPDSIRTNDWHRKQSNKNVFKWKYSEFEVRQLITFKSFYSSVPIWNYGNKFGTQVKRKFHCRQPMYCLRAWTFEGQTEEWKSSFQIQFKLHAYIVRSSALTIIVQFYENWGTYVPLPLLLSIIMHQLKQLFAVMSHKS